MWSMSPPRTSVIALLGVPRSSDVPPHGTAFCGSPRLFWTNVLVGSSSRKCEEAENGASRTTAPMAKDAQFLILEALPSLRSGVRRCRLYHAIGSLVHEVTIGPKDFRFFDPA